MTKTSLSSMIDKLEEVLDNGTKIPVVNKVMVDKEEVFEIIDKMRMAVPESLRNAERMTVDKERFLGEAKEEARKILEAAEAHVAKLIRESEIVQAAQEEAKKIVAEARQMTKEMQAGACEYADATLGGLEENLEKLLRAAKKGRDELKKRGA